MLASARNQLKVVRELLSGEGHPGALIDAATTDGTTSLYIASQHGREAVVKELLSGEGHKAATVKKGGIFSKSPLSVAATPKIKELLKQAMSESATGGRRRRYTYAKGTRRTSRQKRSKKTRRH
jgi:ankyrin repeat protein